MTHWIKIHLKEYNFKLVFGTSETKFVLEKAVTVRQCPSRCPVPNTSNRTLKRIPNAPNFFRHGEEKKHAFVGARLPSSGFGHLIIDADYCRSVLNSSQCFLFRKRKDHPSKKRKEKGSSQCFLFHSWLFGQRVLVIEGVFSP